MDKPKHVTIQEIIADIIIILRKISAVLNDHEHRLQMIEALGLSIEFDAIRLMRISDKNKETKALQEFKNLCNSLGISDLELTQS